MSSGIQTIWLEIWRRLTLTTMPWSLRKGDGFRTKNLDRGEPTVDSHLLLLQIVVGQIWPFNPTRRVCVLPHGHRTIKLQWKRHCGAFGPLGRMQNE